MRLPQQDGVPVERRPDDVPPSGGGGGLDFGERMSKFSLLRHDDGGVTRIGRFHGERLIFGD